MLNNPEFVALHCMMSRPESDRLLTSQRAEKRHLSRWVQPCHICISVGPAPIRPSMRVPLALWRTRSGGERGAPGSVVPEPPLGDWLVQLLTMHAFWSASGTHFIRQSPQAGFDFISSAMRSIAVAGSAATFSSSANEHGGTEQSA